MEIPLIETALLVLTVPGPEHALEFVSFTIENEARLTPWEPPWHESIRSVDFWSKRLADWRDEAVRGVSCRLAMFERAPGGELVGQANITAVVRGALQTANLGYRIGGRFEGRGLMREAAEAAILHGFEALELHRISASYQPTNERSAGLLRRLGFVVEGYARDYLFVGGRWADHILTSRLNPRWRGPLRA